MVKLAMSFVNDCYLIAAAHCGSRRENARQSRHYPGNNQRHIFLLPFVGRG